MAPRRVALALALAVAAGALGFAAVRRRAPLPEVPRDGRFEVAFQVPHVSAAAADDVDIDAAFTAPSGRVIHVGGFFDGLDFRVRFSPSEEGRWSYRVRAGGRQVKKGRFRAGPPVGPARHGRLRRDPEAPERLAWTDGTPLTVIGESRFNVYGPRWGLRAPTIEQALAAMHDAGLNTVRVPLVDECDAPSAIGCFEPRPGHFNPEAARLYDRVFDAAAKYDLGVILVAWAPTSTGGARAWGRSEAERRLAYIAARWGWSRNLIVLDLLDEPERPGAAERAWVPWAEEVARVWRALDRYGHLVTLGSIGLSWNRGGDERPWYASPSNDLIEWHLRGDEPGGAQALSATVWARIEQARRYGKPIVVAEVGGGDAAAAYEPTHVGVWTALFAGAGVLIDTAPPGQRGEGEPMLAERARHLEGVARFAARLSPAHHRSVVLPASPPGTRALALLSPDEIALWVLAPAASAGAPVHDAVVALREMPIAHWRVRFVDELSGALRDGPTVASTPVEPLELGIPTFSRHLAAILTRLPPHAAKP